MRGRRNGVTAAPRQAEHGVARLGHFAGVDDPGRRLPRASPTRPAKPTLNGRAHETGDDGRGADAFPTDQAH